MATRTTKTPRSRKTVDTSWTKQFGPLRKRPDDARDDGDRKARLWRYGVGFHCYAEIPIGFDWLYAGPDSRGRLIGTTPTTAIIEDIATGDIYARRWGSVGIYVDHKGGDLESVLGDDDADPRSPGLAELDALAALHTTMQIVQDESPARDEHRRQVEQQIRSLCAVLWPGR